MTTLMGLVLTNLKSVKRNPIKLVIMIEYEKIKSIQTKIFHQTRKRNLNLKMEAAKLKSRQTLTLIISRRKSAIIGRCLHRRWTTSCQARPHLG